MAIKLSDQLIRSAYVPELATRAMRFRFSDASGHITEPDVHVFAFGDYKKAGAPLVRVHSKCLYGDFFDSVDCDCRAQLEESLRRFRKEGAGILIYLDQEGRGYGLLVKAKGYALKESEGLDTVEAYRRMGLEPDARHYAQSAHILRRHLRINSIRLLSNSPRKIGELRAGGLLVEPVPLRTEPTEANIAYLRVKQLKLGHDLGLRIESQPS